MTRMRYKHRLKKAWKHLIEEYEEGTFIPLCEADIQCFLYHTLINQGLPPLRIHAELPYDKKEKHPQRCDIVVGRATKPQLFVEIGKFKTVRDKDAPAPTWEDDILKLREAKGRKPVLLILGRRKGKTMKLRDYHKESAGWFRSIDDLKKNHPNVDVLSYP